MVLGKLTFMMSSGQDISSMRGQGTELRRNQGFSVVLGKLTFMMSSGQDIR